MRFPVIRLPVVTANPRLPTYDPADISLLVPFEEGALAQWVFGTSDASLTSRISNHVLTKSGTVAYTTNAVTLLGSSGFLQSNIFDTTDMTVLAIPKMPTADASNFFAIFGNFTSGTLTGINADIRPAGGTLNMAFAMTGTTGSPSTAVAGTHSRTIPAGIVAGDWFAMGSVYQTSGASNRAEIFGGSQFVARDMSGFVTPKRNHTTIGLRIGHANTTSSYSTLAREIAEFIVWNRALTNAEIVDAAYRAQVRQAGFGRVVKL